MQLKKNKYPFANLTLFQKDVFEASSTWDNALLTHESPSLDKLKAYFTFQEVLYVCWSLN